MSVATIYRTNTTPTTAVIAGRGGQEGANEMGSVFAWVGARSKLGLMRWVVAPYIILHSLVGNAIADQAEVQGVK